MTKDKPKRPLTAFMRYSQERRPILHKNISSMVEISRRIGEEWRNMVDGDKRPYHDEAEVAHEAYKVLKQEYDKQKPKRPRTAYALFMRENRKRIADKFPNTKPRDLMKHIAQEWNTLEDREIYNTMAREDKERWQRESI